jgi:hypothetical protein
LLDADIAPRDVWLMRSRALLSLALAYRDTAKSFGSQGHIGWAEQVP